MELNHPVMFSMIEQVAAGLQWRAWFIRNVSNHGRTTLVLDQDSICTATDIRLIWLQLKCDLFFHFSLLRSSPQFQADTVNLHILPEKENCHFALTLKGLQIQPRLTWLSSSCGNLGHLLLIVSNLFIDSLLPCHWCHAVISYSFNVLPNAKCWAFSYWQPTRKEVKNIGMNRIDTKALIFADVFTAAELNSPIWDWHEEESSDLACPSNRDHFCSWDAACILPHLCLYASLLLFDKCPFLGRWCDNKNQRLRSNCLHPDSWDEGCKL